MKILLIDPPYDYLQRAKTTLNYPLGPAYMTSYLNKNGHQAVYLNLDFAPALAATNPFSYRDVITRYSIYIRETDPESTHPVWDKFAQAIRDYKPRLVAISMTSVKAKSAFKLANIIKSIDSSITVVLGGHHPQIFAEDILRNVKQADFIVLNEGEQTLLELANELEKNNRRLNDIRGLVFRNGSGDIVFNRPRPLINDLDTLPLPDYCYYYDHGKFIRLPKAAIITSRGCPYQCSYCATNNIWQRKVRRRSPGNVIEEIKTILSQQKEKFLTIYDDCFTQDKRWIAEFCQAIIDQKIKFNWQCITDVNLLEEEIFRKIVQAGCVKINIGVESGSKRILEHANKNINLENVKRIFRLAKKYRISATAYIMVGFPTESKDDILLTQQFIKEIRPDWVYCNVLIPLPGTGYYDWCQARHLMETESAWRGDTIKNIIMNFTGNLTDQEFFKLIDQTFRLCYKINTNIINLIKRAPLKSYIFNPGSALSDIKHALQYIKR
jgi:radical SAM superfamily enzyme YgiQ (UPF0313 family)